MEFIVDNLKYTTYVANYFVYVTSVDTTLSGAVNIPSNVNYERYSCRVIIIGGQAFLNCTGITSVTIPNTVSRIAESAFEGCTGLTSIIIPSSVTRIDRSLLKQCSSL